MGTTRAIKRSWTPFARWSRTAAASAPSCWTPRFATSAEVRTALTRVFFFPQGPEIRTKNLRQNPTVDGKRSWFLERGDKFVFHTDEAIEGDNTHVAVTYANFPKVLKGARERRVSCQWWRF